MTLRGKERLAPLTPHSLFLPQAVVFTAPRNNSHSTPLAGR